MSAHLVRRVDAPIAFEASLHRTSKGRVRSGRAQTHLTVDELSERRVEPDRDCNGRKHTWQHESHVLCLPVTRQCRATQSAGRTPCQVEHF